MRIARVKVVVVGSLNLDYIASVQRLPAPGHTIAAGELIRRFGGKGANQAVAAARQGARVEMIGCVGNDADGSAYLERLRNENIGNGGILVSNDTLTGTALIAVDRNGENMIIVAAGANGRLTAAAVSRQRACIVAAGALLLQFEVPMDSNLAAIRHANQSNIPVVLNPSPLREGFPWGKCDIRTLIVNAGETEAIFGLSPIQSGIRSWSAALAKFRVTELIVTRGARPTVCFTKNERSEVPTLRVRPVDTVGAGDAFAGTFVARRVEGLDLLSAIRFANCAGALTTQMPGAQEAIPTRRATENAVRKIKVR